MSKFKTPEGKELEMVQQAFAEIEAVETLVHPTLPTSPGKISAGDLFAYASGDGARAAQVKVALLKYPAMGAALKSMLGSAALYHIPEAIAASTDEFPERRAGGCIMRVEASRAEPDQHYLIIEIMSGHETPSMLTLCSSDNQVEILDLPAPRRGVVQLPITADSGIPDLLRDPKTAVFLR